MTKLTYCTATTLDGFIADPDDSLDWLLRQEQDADGFGSYDEFIANVGAIVRGSTTYEWALHGHSHRGSSRRAGVVVRVTPLGSAGLGAKSFASAKLPEGGDW